MPRRSSPTAQHPAVSMGSLLVIPVYLACFRIYPTRPPASTISRIISGRASAARSLDPTPVAKLFIAPRHRVAVGAGHERAGGTEALLHHELMPDAFAHAHMRIPCAVANSRLRACNCTVARSPSAHNDPARRRSASARTRMPPLIAEIVERHRHTAIRAHRAIHAAEHHLARARVATRFGREDLFADRPPGHGSYCGLCRPPDAATSRPGISASA